MLKLPHLRALQAFEAVGRLGSVTDGAGELGVSPGAISQQIRKIESNLGVTLLERHGKRLELTSLGRIYYAELSRAFEQLRNAQEILQHARTKTGLVLSSLPSVASKWIGRQLDDWHAKYPDMPIRLIGSESEDCFAGQVDFRITYGDNIRGFDHYVELFTDWAVPVCAPSLIKNRVLRSEADILSLPLLGIEWGRNQSFLPSWNEWAASIGIQGPHRAPHLSFSLSASAIDAAVDGQGFVLGQLSMIAHDIAVGRLVIPFDRRIRLPAPYFLAWDRTVFEKSLGSEFKAWLIATAKRQEKASAPTVTSN